ncbi:MAG: 2,3-bisphosphoglycerate-independent phosphoglycerate mutase [Lentisphaerae bacterium]|nr:2,3-bisphosphoglycerate-independent phosphoglycerate mutase [Lentisphaerota bacterium]
MLKALEKNSKFNPRRGPVVLAILDGVGFGKYADGDAVAKANMPVFKGLMAENPTVALKAHGTAVGMPSDDDMGNSEVGHNAIGSGRVFSQGAKLVGEAVASGKLFEGEVWQKLVANVKEKNSALHLIGLISDGNVHSHIDHLFAMLDNAAAAGVEKVRVHALFDGRDVPETSAMEYVKPLEEKLAAITASGKDYRIASGGGRMVITMDRYGANWNMVKRGWDTHVLGKGEFFTSATEAVTALRERTGAIDQDLPAFVISDDGKNPVGAMKDGDSVVLFNFRGDRALEITAAFESGDDFDKFDRGARPDVMYAGMMEYDGDLHAPKLYLVNPPEITETMDEYLCASKVKQLAISETQKYGHVTYFFNGNRSGKFDEVYDEYVEIRSDVVPFEQRPWMKCAEITDAVVEAIASGKYQMIRLNFPNGDMVGHTGSMEAVLVSMEALDLCLGRIKEAVKAAGGVLVISADHGNADDMLEHDKKGNLKVDANGVAARKTSHSLNPVPCIIYDPENQGEYESQLKEGLGISSLAATCIELLGLKAPENYDPSVLNWK